MPGRRQKGGRDSHEAELRRQREQAAAATQEAGAEQGATDQDEAALQALAAESGVSVETLREGLETDTAEATSNVVTFPGGTIVATGPDALALAAGAKLEQLAGAETSNVQLEVRLRLEAGLLPEEVAADGVIRALTNGLEDAEVATVIAEQVEALVPTLKNDAEVGQWWTMRKQPEGPAYQVAKLVPPFYVATEQGLAFVPMARIADEEVEAYNAAHTPQVHTNGTAKHAETEAPAADPRAGAVAILKAIMAGEDLPPAEEIERALASLEQFNAGTASAPASGRAPRAARSTTPGEGDPPDRKGADGKSLPKLWRAKAFGPFTVGASNAMGGTVVRDTRTADKGKVFDKAAEAKAYVDGQLKKLKDAEKAKLEEAAKATIGANGTAR